MQKLSLLQALPRSDAVGPLAALLLAICWPGAGCRDSGNGNRIHRFQNPDNAPRLAEAVYVDENGNGVDEGDKVLLRFNRRVILQGGTLSGILSSDIGESFGDDPELMQSIPGSEWVEAVLGEDADLSPGPAGGAGVTRVQVGQPGTGLVDVEGTNGQRAFSRRVGVTLEDSTAAAPLLIQAIFVDADSDGAAGAGDLIIASFDKPIAVKAGDALAANFILPVAGDAFGAGATIDAATSLATNRAVRITLGAGAALTVPGTFSAAAFGAGSPSGLSIPVTATIGDTTAGAVVIGAGASADIALQRASFFGNGRGADAALGNIDAFTAALTAQGVDDPAGIDSFSGTISIGGDDFAADLLFVADRGNDRVLIFENFPSGDFAAASWILGKPSFEEATDLDPADPVVPRPTAASLRRPAGIAFDAAANRLFVSDSGNHRLMAWSALFFVDPATGDLAVENGRAASFVLGQASFTADRPNRGEGAPSAASLSSPGGLSIGGGKLAVADPGNHRILIFGSLPSSAAGAPAVVLGQPDFVSGLSNGGGAAPGAATLSAPQDVFIDPAISINASTGTVIAADTGNNRVLIWETGAPASGSAADVVLGQALFTTAAPGAGLDELDGPAGVAADAGTPLIYAADRGNHRVIVYDASGGIADGDAGAAIGGAGAPAAGTLRFPERVEVAGTALVVADSKDHRVLAYQGPALPTGGETATLVLGQTSLDDRNAPNGRRLNRPMDTLVVAGRLILSDTGNHRVLIYNAVPLAGDPDPDVVLGQPDLFSTQANQGGAAGAATLFRPTGLASEGSALAVADTGNHRILVWLDLAAAADGDPADLVLGQPDFVTAAANSGGPPSAATLNAPEGLFFFTDRLVVADRDNHRVLFFLGFAAGIGFADGLADVLLGQEEFHRTEPNRGRPEPGRGGLNRPRDVIAGGGRFYVADSGNHRVLIWDKVPTPNSNRGADGVLGQVDLQSAVPAGAGPGTLLEPSGLAIDPEATVLLIADSGHHQVVIYDRLGGDLVKRPGARYVLGQSTLSAGDPNQGLLSPSTASLFAPRGLFFNGYELYAADTGNSRVLSFR